MQNPTCPYCIEQNSPSEVRSRVYRAGFYYRKSDRKRVRKFRCADCFKHFSRATDQRCYRQNKRHINHQILRLLCSGVSQRRISKILRLSRTTVARKLVFLGSEAKAQLQVLNLEKPKAQIVEFDDLETFEHTKCKPLSVTLAVEHKTRRILDFEVSQMPAKGRLVKIAFKKYGPRADHRSKGRAKLFSRLQKLVSETAEIKSDENPHYPPTVRAFFPQAKHVSFKGQRGSITGQGELKKIRFDPLFSLNHTCAMFRANVNRLFRKTWCTTKKPERLSAHLSIYALYHNILLIKEA